MTNYERMLKGELYRGPGSDPEITKLHKNGKRLMRLYNETTEEEQEKRQAILKELLGKVGSGVTIEPPLRIDYGIHIEIGDNFYANFDTIFLDVNRIIIGDNVLFGPRVSVYTAGHPIDAEVRNEYLEFGKEIVIGNNVWIGGNTVINPGVTIGDNVVIGSGSVVTKDIPANTIAVGNPCRVLRQITEKDKAYWTEQREAYYQSMK